MKDYTKKWTNEQLFTEFNPLEITEYRLVQVDMYAQLAEQEVRLQRLYAEWWESHRPKHKSDASCNREWDRTKEGLDMMEIHVKMKVKLLRIGALKTLIESKGLEARNNY